MNKFFLCKVLIYLFFLVTIRLFSMPGADGVPAQPDASAQPAVMPAQPDASAQPAAQPDSSTQPAAQPADTSVQPTAGPQPQATPPAEEIKHEKLGEFQLSENQPDMIKDNDPKIKNLVKKSNELNKQIDDIVNKIKEIHDNVFNKFSEINNLLDAFYQKIGFESGRVHELLKEEK